ncbi:hypothetical protein JHK87_044605 [Glycine soja]|nr:hypothetical protein JHK87_044605 [Glycine soja]
MENLSLVDEEEGELVFHVEKEQERRVVFLTSKSVRVQMMKEHMASVWQLKKGVTIKELDNERQPLAQNKKIKKPGEEWNMVHFKYEKLGQYCYLCRMLVHGEKLCDILFTTNGMSVVKGVGMGAESRQS